MSYIMHDSLVCILYVFLQCMSVYIYIQFILKVHNISLYILCHVICITLHNIQCTCYIYVIVSLSS